METGRNCAYNVTRNTLLSDRVMAAVGAAGPAEVLSLVLKGPGIDRQSGVWLRGGAGPDLPRAIDFDVIYMDDGQRIIAAAGVGLGTGYPSIDEGVASLLILANGRLADTGTIAGDQIRICGEAELAVLLKTASQSPLETREQTAVEASESTPPAPISFEVSRLSEFVFEPFVGSLMYLPQIDVPQPQSTEYFLTREVADTARAGAADDMNAVLSAGANAKERNESVIWERQNAGQEEPAAAEEPHFYAPKPVRFFDPALADESHADETERPAGRGSIHLSAELKAAIRRIDEELRRNKEKLEERGKAKKARKEKKKKDRREDETRVIEQQEVQAVSPEPVEAAALPEPVAADTAVLRKAKQEAPLEAAPAAVEAEQEVVAGPSAPEIQESPVEAAEEPLLAMEPEPVLMTEPVVEEEVLQAASEPEMQELPVETAEEPVLAMEPEPVLMAEPVVEVLQSASGPEVQELPVETAEEPEPATEPEPVLLEPAVTEEVVEATAEEAEPAVEELPVEVAQEPVLAMEPEPVLLEPAVTEEVLEIASEPEVPELPVEVEPEPVSATEPEPVLIEPPTVVSEAQIEAPVSAVAEVEELAPEEVELQLEETLPATRMTLPPEREIEPVALAPSAAASPITEPAPVRDKVTEIKKSKKIKEPEPPAPKEFERKQEKLSLGTRLQRWIGGEASLRGERRKGDRLSPPGMVAYYWSGGAPKPHEIVNISKTGFYLRTKEIWLPDTMVRMTLQRPHQTEEGKKESISILARVVRIDEDGVGHEFVTSEVLHAVRSHEILPEMGTNRKELERFLGQGSRSRKR